MIWIIGPLGVFGALLGLFTVAGLQWLFWDILQILGLILLAGGAVIGLLVALGE